MYLVYLCRTLPQFGLNKLQFDTLLATLKVVEEDALLGAIRHPGHGICRNWAHELECLERPYACPTPYDLVPYLSAKWPGSQNPGRESAWPVPHNRYYSLWKSTNLERRLDLIRYMRKRLRDLKRRAREA